LDKRPNDIVTLPLFPLNCVLFPQFPVQLQIIEERYVTMIRRCLDQDSPFGVVLIREGEEIGPPARPHDVGCVARILTSEQMPDGRMELVAVGEQRFRLLEYHVADLPYLIGRVEIVDDEPPDSSGLAVQIEEGRDLFRRYLRLVSDLIGRSDAAEIEQMDLPMDPVQLSFCIAAVAHMPLTARQRLLASFDTSARLRTEIDLLKSQVEALEAMKDNGEVRTIVMKRLDLSSERSKSHVSENRN
jgi:Lon protease-like protein